MDTEQIKALHQAQDKQLPTSLQNWISLQAPLSSNTHFIPTNTRVHNSSAFIFLFIAIAFAVAGIGLIYVSAETSMLVSILVIILIAAMASGWQFHRQRYHQKAYKKALQNDTWRLGYLLNPDFYGSRTSKNYNYLIPRNSVLQFYQGQNRVHRGQGQSHKSFWIAVQYRLHNGKSVDLLLHETRAIDKARHIRQAKLTLNQWANGYAQWLETGETESLSKLYQETQVT